MQDSVDVSVIVPARNVELYVGELLEDLTNQRFTSFEVILVDDASTDETSNILREACRRDPRFRMVETPGVGPGAARNAGIDRSIGRRLAFVDADDRISEHHLASLHRACVEHETPFAMCSGERLHPDRRFPSAVYRRPFSPPVPATSHISRRHRLLYDTTMTNKLIDRDFWLKTVGSFPEGILHEDLRPSIQLHLAASEVAMVNERSYLWRVRSKGERSITQNRGSVEALEDRVRALSEIHQLLEDFGDPALVEAFLLRAIRFDLGLQLKYSTAAPDEYLERLRQTASEYLELTGPQVLNSMSLNKRAAFGLLFAGSHSALRAVAPRMLAKRPAFNVETRRDIMGRVTLRAVPHQPSSFSRRDQRTLGKIHVDASDAAPWATLNTVHFQGGSLHLIGHLGLERLLSTTPWLQAVVVISDRGDKRSFDVPTSVDWEDEGALRPDGVLQGLCGTFEAVVPVDRLLPRSGKSATFNVRIEITLAPGYVTGVRIRMPETAAERLAGVAHHSRDHGVYPYATKRGNLSIKVLTLRYVAGALSQTDATRWPRLLIEGPADCDPDAAIARMGGEEYRALLIERDGLGFAIDLAPLTRVMQAADFDFVIADASGRFRLLGAGPPQEEVTSGGARFQLSCDTRGFARLRVWPASDSAATWGLKQDHLVLDETSRATQALP